MRKIPDDLPLPKPFLVDPDSSFARLFSMSTQPCVTVGGAKSSHVAPSFHKIPIEALRRLGLRFQLGQHYDDPSEAAKINGRQNWQDGDETFWIERYNHAFEHLTKYASGDRSEDHLAAVMWYCAARMATEERQGIFPVESKT